MSLRLRAAELFLPGSLKRRYLVKLFRLTADAFGSDAPVPGTRSLEALLDAYEAFTDRKAREALALGTGEDAGETLYRGARGFGEELREALGVRTVKEAMVAARILYRAIGIDFEARPDGAVVIRACRFAKTYAPEVCRLISSLDRGILAGLSAGGDLRFAARLTEGRDSCRAQFSAPGERP